VSKQTSGLKPFKPGETLNPGGRPVGARTRLTGRFLNLLADDFEANGKQAIIDCRQNKPDQYLKVVAALLPKEVQITRPLEGFTDDELLAIAEHLRSQVGTEPGATGNRPETVTAATH
jgi:hypothetical protein